MSYHIVQKSDEEKALVAKMEDGQSLTFRERKELSRLIKNRQPKEYYSLQKERIEKTRKQGFVVETIWPRAGFHALVGSSGVGKSTWLLQAIHDWEHGLPILGFKSHPAPYVYIMCDRAQTELQESLDRLGLGNWDIKGYSIEQLSRAPFELHPENLDIEDLVTTFRWAEVFFIEGYTYWYKNKSANATKDYTDTLRFWGKVRDHFAEQGKTIIGTGHQPKNKSEGVTRTRDKIFGSVGQGAVIGTVMVMEDDPKHKGVRTLTIDPRNAKEFSVTYSVGPLGELVYNKVVGGDKEEEKEDTGAFTQLNAKLSTFQQGDLLIADTVREWKFELDVSKATTYRWLKAMLDGGVLIRVGRGIWRKGFRQ